VSEAAATDTQQGDSISLALHRRFGGFSRESVLAAVEELTRRLTEAQQQAAQAEASAAALRAERDQLAQEVARFRDIERSLTQTLALAEEAARARQREAEEEARRLVEEARADALSASRAAVQDRDRALQEIARIREQLERAMAELDRVPSSV
jgi:chromosome segregation ATPase